MKIAIVEEILTTTADGAHGDRVLYRLEPVYLTDVTVHHVIAEAYTHPEPDGRTFTEVYEAVEIDGVWSTRDHIAEVPGVDYFAAFEQLGYMLTTQMERGKFFAVDRKTRRLIPVDVSA